MDDLAILIKKYFKNRYIVDVNKIILAEKWIV